jgi:hypothetical protein
MMTLRARISAIAFAAALLLAAHVLPAYAGDQGGASSCAADQAGISLNCTAEDVTIANIDLLAVVDGCAAVGDTAIAEMSLSLEINAAQRYDIGVYISTDGGNAQTGSCFKEYLPPPLVGAPTDADLATGYGPYWSGGADADVCGDAEQNDVLVDPVRRLLSTPTDAAAPAQVTLDCRDSDDDGFLDFDYCTGWRNNTKFTCNGLATAGIVQTAAKCKCGVINIGIPVPNASAPPVLELSKTVMLAGGTCGVDDVDELNVPVGSSVEYCYVLENTSLADAWDVVLTDDNATPGNSADDFTVTLTGLTELENNGDANDLAAGATATGQSASIAIGTAGTRVNIATATAVDPSTSAPLSVSDPATVNSAEVGDVTNTACASGQDSFDAAAIQTCDSVTVNVRFDPPSISLVKTVMPSSGVCGVDDVDSLEVLVGGSVRYCYVVTAGGSPDLNRPVYDISLEDDNGTPGDTADDFPVPLSGLTEISGNGGANDLAAGATATGVSGVILISSPQQRDNIAVVTGSDPEGGAPLVADDTARVTAALRPSGISLAKTAMPEGGTCGVDDFENLFVTTTNPNVVYCYYVRANGTPGTYDPVFNVSLVDDMGTPGDPADDQTITLSPLSNLDGGGTDNDLQAGATATGQSTAVTVP